MAQGESPSLATSEGLRLRVVLGRAVSSGKRVDLKAVVVAICMTQDIRCQERVDARRGGAGAGEYLWKSES